MANNKIFRNDELQIRVSNSDPALLSLHNLSNGSGSGITFTDHSSESQVGYLRFYHADGSSQGGGATFQFLSTEADMTLQVGGAGKASRVVVWSANSTAKVDYGFADDVNTGMTRVAADQVGLIAGGSRKLLVNSSGVTINNGDLYIDDYVYHSGNTTTYFGFSAANEFLVVAGGSNKFAADANAAYMYYQGGVKLQTTSTGVTVTGSRSIFAADTVVSSYSGTSVVEVYKNAGDSILTIHQDDGNHESKLHFRTGGNDTFIRVPASTNALQIDSETTTDAFILSHGGNGSFAGGLTVGDDFTVVGNNLTIQGQNPYIQSTHASSLRIKHTSGQIMYFRPDENGTIAFFTNSNAINQFIYLQAPSAGLLSSNNSSIRSPKIVYEARAKQSDASVIGGSFETHADFYDIGYGYMALHLGSSANDKVIIKNLEVTGTTTTVNQTNLDISDNIIGLNRGATSNSNDSGIIIERGSTGNNAAFLWDESQDRFIFGTTTDTPAATGNVNFAYAPFASVSIWGTSSAVTHWGNATTAYGTLTWDTGYARVHAEGSNALHLGSGSDNDAVQIVGSNTSFAGNIDVNGTSSDIAFVGGSMNFKDANSYIRITKTSASAQLGLFRAGDGGMYIGGSSGGFRIYTESFAQKFLLSQSGDGTFSGNVELAAAKRLIFADDKIKIGSTSTPGAQGIQVGYAATASGAQAIAFGYDSNATGNQSIAMGYNSTASGLYSQAYGYNVTASGQGTVVFGTSGSHSETNTFVASGLNLKVTGTGISTFAGETNISQVIDGPFTALRLMNQKTYGAGTGTNEKVRFAMGISESGIAFSGREGFVIELGISDEGDSSNGVVDFKVRDGGVLGTYSTVTGSNKSVSFVGDVQAPGIYIGSTNTAYDLYNNGTTYLNGATTIDDNLTINGAAGSTGNALSVNRGSDGSQAMRIQNSGEVVIPSNYLYCNAGGTSLYVQNSAVFRGAILNDGGDVRIADNLKVDNKIGIGVSPTTLLHIKGTGDAIRVESTNTGAGGAQMDLLHFTTSPADEDTHAVINMGGYYQGTTSVYGTQIKSIWTDVSERHSRLEFTTCDTSVSTALTLAHDNSATFTGEISQVYNPGNTGAFQYMKNANAGANAYTSKKWQNDDAGFGEIWRNSSTRSATGQGASSFNMYNSADINFWAGTGHTLNLSGTKATFIGNVNVKTNIVQIDQDGTYGGSYGTVGFGGKANGSNRVFGHTGTGDGLFLASATGRGVFIRTNGSASDTHTFGSNGFVGMGIANTNNQRLTLAEADGNGSHLKMNNARSGGGYWVVGVGDNNSNSSIVDPGGLFFYNGSTKLKLASNGNATFAATLTAKDTTISTGSTVALAAQPSLPLYVSNGGASVDGRVFINVKHDQINSASAPGAGIQMQAGAVTSGTASYFSSQIFLQSAAQGNQTIHSAPKNIKFYVDNHDTAAGAGSDYNAFGDLALTLNENKNATFAGSLDVGTFTLAGSGIVADAGMTLQTNGGGVNAITLTTAGIATFSTDLNVNGNTFLGNASGDYVHVNDKLYVGATDSGNAEFWFGEGSTGDVNYGARWYWDSGYTHQWYTVNNSTETLMMSYATNDTSKVQWFRNFDMNNKKITELATPTASTDAANKAYVDSAVSGAGSSDTTYNFNMNTQLTADAWTDTGVSGNDMATGIYIMRCYVSDFSIAGQHYYESYGATMSWYGSGTNEATTPADEIIVHRAGHAPNSGDVQFRTLRGPSADLKLQVKHNLSHTAAPDQSSGKEFKFTFRKMI